MKSLSLKLGLFYIISVVIIVVAILSYIEFCYARESEVAAREKMEFGPGYINGATPSDYSDQFGDIMKLIRRKSLEPRYIMDNLPEVINLQTLDNTIFIISIDKLDDNAGDDLEYYLIDINISEIGAIIVPGSRFPQTISNFQDIGKNRYLYYMPLEGYENVVLVASLDGEYSPGPTWRNRLWEDLKESMFLILVFSAFFGLIISLAVTTPIKRIAATAEKLSHDDFGRRVDITSNDEIGSLANSFNRMACRIQAAFKSQRQFISDAAHSLKTPLASMKYSVTSALEESREADEYRQVLDFVNSRLSAQEELINDLLFLSRADENLLKTEERIINLSRVAHNTAEAFGCLFEEKQINFIKDLKPGVTIEGDEKLIVILLSNLLENAIKNTHQGGTVILAVLKDKANAKIEVSDNGNGIPEEHLEHIFERFYRVPGSENEDNGSGLGLAICKSIAEALGGKISVESRVNKGCTFIVALPVSKNG
ncbi:MAG: HAMP domain-containing histidine kinase [Limnochordia bacterium]|nr:HAMP domain-containing histidine kinase [Limnochordia bacterium]